MASEQLGQPTGSMGRRPCLTAAVRQLAPTDATQQLQHLWYHIDRPDAVACG